MPKTKPNSIFQPQSGIHNLGSLDFSQRKRNFSLLPTSQVGKTVFAFGAGFLTIYFFKPVATAFIVGTSGIIVYVLTKKWLDRRSSRLESSFPPMSNSPFSEPNPFFGPSIPGFFARQLQGMLSINKHGPNQIHQLAKQSVELSSIAHENLGEFIEFEPPHEVMVNVIDGNSTTTVVFMAKGEKNSGKIHSEGVNYDKEFKLTKLELYIPLMKRRFDLLNDTKIQDAKIVNEKIVDAEYRDVK